MPVLNTTALRSLYCELARAGFEPIPIREILSAAYGLKVSRLTLDDDAKDRLERIASRFGLATDPGDAKYLAASDVGKKTWKNLFVRKVSPAVPGGYWKVCVATDMGAASRASEMDASGDHEGFGEILGIPRCCREYYCANVPRALSKQGDFLPITRANTPGAYPFNHWTNYAARYFGYSMLSFDACSFRCPNAAAAARVAFGLLSRIDLQFACRFMSHHRKSVLYTEYDGVYLLADCRYDGGTVWCSLADGTESGTPLASALSRADNLSCPAPGAGPTLVRRGTHVLYALHDEIALCVF
jgi:hypothetical protein